MNDYEQLTRQERIRRVGALLSKAVTLMHTAEQNAGRIAVVAEVAAKVDATEEDWITCGMVNYMKKFGWATPKEMRLHLDVKRTTLFRRLRTLFDTGLLEKRGHSRGTQYRILAIVS